MIAAFHSTSSPAPAAWLSLSARVRTGFTRSMPTSAERSSEASATAMKSLAYTLACSPVSSCCAAYFETDGIVDGAIAVPAFGWASAALGGNRFAAAGAGRDVGGDKAVTPGKQPFGYEQRRGLLFRRASAPP